MQTQYYFIHLPKCAGTSLLRSLSRMRKRRLMIVSTFPQSKRAAKEGLNQQLTNRRMSIDDLDLIFGHDVFYGIHEQTSRPVQYATVMRDPVQRWISQYRYIVDCSQDKKSPIHDFAHSKVVNKGQILSMDDCVQKGYWTNMMTNYLAAALDPNLDSARWEIQSDDQLLEMATTFVDQMDFIGFVDSIVEDEATIAGWFGLKPKLKVVNSSKTKVVDEISDQTLEAIEQINSIDQVVYDRAKASRISN